MIIDERIVEDGGFERIHLDVADGRIVLRDDQGSEHDVRLELILAVIRRYGRPLDDTIGLPSDGIELAPGIELRRLTYRAAVDAGPRDYAVLCVAERPPLAVMSTTFTGALRHLVAKDNAS